MKSESSRSSNSDAVGRTPQECEITHLTHISENERIEMLRLGLIHRAKKSAEKWENITSEK